MKEKLIDAAYVVGTFLVFGGLGVLLAWRG
jgi:hypothetical protein